MGSRLLMGRRKELGVCPLVRSQVVVLAWILGQNSLNTRNSEVPAGRRETEGKGHLEGRRQVGPFPMPDGEACTLTEAVSE